MVISKRKCIILDNKLTAFLADSKRQLITLEIPNRPTLIEKADVIDAISLQFKIERKYVELSVQDLIALPMSMDGLLFEELYIVKVDDVCNIKKLQDGSSLLLSYALNSFQIGKFEVSSIEKKFLKAVLNRFKQYEIDHIIHLGGAFSPWGKHHSGILLSLVEQFSNTKEKVKIVICPSADADTKTKMKFELRKKIIEEVISELELTSIVEVSDINNKEKERTTYDVIMELEDKYNPKYIKVVLGQDNLTELYYDEWEDGDRLLAKENLSIIGIRRDTHQEFSSSAPFHKKDIIFMNNSILETYTNSSSSMIRMYLFAGKTNILSLLVHSSTLVLLKKHYDEICKAYNK